MFRGNPGAVEVTGHLEGAFEAIVGDFHGVTAAAFLDGPVAALSADSQGLSVQVVENPAPGAYDFKVTK